MARYAYVIAQAYGQSNYNDCTYNDSTSCPATTTGSTGTSTSGSSNPLANTGIAVLGMITLACLIIFIALVVRMMGRRRQVPVAEPVSVDDDTDEPSSVPPAASN